MNSSFEEKDYKIFDLFKNQWALVTAGSMERFNSCTVGWGSMGTLWTRPGKSGSVMTVYLHPSRYTREVMMDSGTFTVSFFPKGYKRALGYMGSRSGRDGDKVEGSGLTPVAVGGGVSYEEAELVFVCRKLYQHKFSKDELAPEIREYYKGNPQAYPADENGDWQPHWVFVGDIEEVVDRR
ncbi:MAG: flavin reductase [Oscillospiraceae bacterium]|nr:flavin reductase [Oscillospiraceae bacterium]